jgi:toxin YoeB
VRVHFTANAWKDFQHWVRNDEVILERISDLIEDIRRTPFKGRGKPEALKGNVAGWWARRIAGEHRLLYRVAGKAGVDQYVEIATCRYHYE